MSSGLNVVDGEHVPVNVEVQRRTEALDEGGGAGSRAQPGAPDGESGRRPAELVNESSNVGVPVPRQELMS